MMLHLSRSERRRAMLLAGSVWHAAESLISRVNNSELVKVTQELKNTHMEQLGRLHLKHQTECDLLEDMRTYSQKKATLERDYAQSRCTVSHQPSRGNLENRRTPLHIMF
ncbi:hypothetical protein DNTS_014243 [Danionella cerebrum]|uniref:Uncharacterized protein n=1 Tax=Danionella cerebrum TaxID=2873325 RepID=A0A553RIZ0_9TELE|nr:hypothetical protein DNTS_014243 [Danionella translucida]